MKRRWADGDANINPTLAVSGSDLSGAAPFSVALRVDGVIAAQQSPAGQRGDLARLCADVCEQRGIAPRDVAAVLVDVGPGSYTGLRVATTFARCLQAFGGTVVGAVSSLALLALAGVRTASGRRLRPLLDARRGRLHTALYELDDGQLQQRQAPAALPVDEAIAAIDDRELVILPLSLGDRIAERLGANWRERCCTIEPDDVGAARLFAPELPMFVAEFADLEPNYLMASYAEEA